MQESIVPDQYKKFSVLNGSPVQGGRFLPAKDVPS